VTTTRDLAASLRWADEGTERLLRVMDQVGDDALAGPTALPCWTGRHLVAHVAANAEALRNLAHWAATGVETPMYTSPAQRDADIETGARRPAAELRRWAAESAGRLGSALASLTDDQWSRTVRTAQGRLVPAIEIPWLRAREVMVHSVDLDPTDGFDDLPEDFLLALVEDIALRRSDGRQPAVVLCATGGRRRWSVSGRGEPAEVHGSLGAIVAYLAGRPGAEMTSSSGSVPDLPPWL
jgi:maleylpyruvate isomerase